MTPFFFSQSPLELPSELPMELPTEQQQWIAYTYLSHSNTQINPFSR
jgi:hypothetical protein